MGSSFIHYPTNKNKWQKKKKTYIKGDIHESGREVIKKVGTGSQRESQNRENKNRFKNLSVIPWELRKEPLKE